MRIIDNNKNHDRRASLDEEAAKWFVRDQRGLTENEKAEFERKCLETPELLSVFNEYEETQSIIDEVPSEVASEFLEFGDENAFRRRSMYWYALPLAAALLLFFSIFVSNDIIHLGEGLSTQALADGSNVRLNAGAKIDVRFNENERVVFLEKGEAFFKVHKDKNRPFVVVVGDVRVQAVGTAFNVIKDPNNIGVIVTEGVVKVFSVEQEAETTQSGVFTVSENRDIGEFIREGHRAEIAIVPDVHEPCLEIEVFETATTEIESHLAWRNSLLTIDGESLRVIARNFEKNTGYKLVIVDPKLKDRKIGGRFPSDDVYGFMSILKNGYGIDWKEVEPGLIEVGRK